MILPTYTRPLKRATDEDGQGRTRLMEAPNSHVRVIAAAVACVMDAVQNTVFQFRFRREVQSQRHNR